ncbi:beta strand repeat-containing protein, partial [Flavobacterium macacae]
MQKKYLLPLYKKVSRLYGRQEKVKMLCLLLFLFLAINANAQIGSIHPLNVANSGALPPASTTGAGTLSKAATTMSIMAAGGATDALISNNVFLQGQYVEVGISPCGAFGSTVAQPSGYHGNVGGRLGFVADPLKDGWNVGSPPFNGDYFLPGSPEEGFGVQINGTNYGNYAQCSENNIPMTSVSKSFSNDTHYGNWEGTIDGLKIKQTVSFMEGDTYFIIKVELTNTTSSVMNNVYYMRNVDPDNEAATGGGFETNNAVVYQPTTDPCGRALVSATGTIFGHYLGLATIDTRARVTYGGFSNRHAGNIWNGIGLEQSGSRIGDEAISLSYNIGNIAPGVTETVIYTYILDASQIENALNSTSRIYANGVDITAPLAYSYCSQPLNLEVVNGENITWTWSPSTYLNTTTGTSVIVNAPAGTYNFNASGVNACGYTTSYDFTIQLSDDILPPVANAKDITVYLDATGTYVLSASQVNDNSSDNCTTPSDLIYSISPSEFDCASIGANTVTLTVTDASGLSSTDTAIVTVLETAAPTVITQNLTVQLGANGQAVITPAQINNGSTDNCAIASYALSTTTFTCANVGTNTVTLAVTDTSGNVSTGTATVIVQDTIAPILGGSSSMSVPPNSTNSWAPWTYTFSDPIPSGSVLSGVSLNFVARDQGWGGTGDSAHISLTGTHIGSAQLFGSDQNYSINYNQTVPSYVYGGTNTLQWSFTGYPGWQSYFNGGTLTVHYLNAGAVASTTIYLDANGNATATAAEFDNGSATDNCTVASIALAPNSFTCENIGTTTAVFTATDPSNNSATRNVTITVLDAIAPTIIAQNITINLDENGTYNLTPAEINNGSFDNCGISTWGISQSLFTCSNAGQSLNVTLFGSDASGNLGSAVAVVTIQDLIAPTVITQNVSVPLDANGQAVITPAQINNGSTDNCSIAT